VGRTVRVVVIVLMARNAGRAGQVEVVIDVAIGTSPRRNRMASRQRKSHRVVIELRVQPVIRTVALFAGGRIPERDVIRSPGALEVRLMARVAHRRHDLKLAVGGILVAGIAIHRCVRPGKGEAIIVLLNVLDCHLPTANRVALLTIRAQLPLVKVGMAVLATRAHVAEHWLHMALCACDVFVHATQRITSLIVIEFRNSSDGLPAIRGVTILAGNV